MNDYIYIGKIVNTHGIKGEVRISTMFYERDLLYKNNSKIYITPLYKEEEIISHRIHKGYDMVMFKGINNINDVLKYKGSSVYVKRSDLDKADYLISDLIGYNIIFNNDSYGKVKEIIYGNNMLLKIDYDNTYYIPYNDVYIISVDINNKNIIVNDIRGLII